jgi:branched-chain amino acid transport system permease protein
VSGGRATAVALALLALGAPALIRSDFWLGFLVTTLLYAYLGAAWNILGGYGGQFSFGHALFFGTGAYASSILAARWGINPWLGLVAAAAAGGLVAAFVGALSFRFGLRGSYFALVTLAFAELFRILANSLDVTGAGVGLYLPLRPGLANFQFASKTGYYYVALALAAAAILVAWRLENSRLGARLVAIRENEDAARALGVDAFATKLAAIVLSGALTAAGGTFYAQYYLYIDPGIAYGSSISVEILLVPIVGGLGTIAGPLFGAAALQLLAELARRATGDAPGLNLVLYGVLLILMVRFLPDGLVGLLRRLVRRRPARAHA